MKTPTRDRILVAATDLFGTRGVDAVSLDVIAAEVGVAKQTLLYWFPSKDDLVQAVLIAAAHELSVVIDAAVRAATDDPLDRIESVIRAVFRPAVRRPALLGLIREVSRLPSAAGDRLTADLAPLVDRAVSFLQHEMDAGRLRRADPRLVASRHCVTPRSPVLQPSPKRCASSAGNRPPPVSAACATSYSPSSAPPSPPDPTPHSTLSPPYRWATSVRQSSWWWVLTELISIVY